MVRQYRIDRFNGLDVLVCECYDKHLMTEKESQAIAAWVADNPDLKYEDFRRCLDDYLADGSNYDEQYKLSGTFYGLVEPIPVYDSVPFIVLRGVVVNNRVSSLQVDFNAGCTVNVLDHEIDRFLRYTQNVHWRDSMSHQIER